ncbi:MAG: histidine kinase [Actinomycetia bacterium]|nr:histidine kinase [Actinomycetes bacterium]
MTDAVAGSPPSRSRDVSQAFEAGVGRAKRFATGVSVRTKILGIVVTMTMILGLGITLQVRSVMSSVLITELDNRGASVASDLAARAADPLLLDAPFEVYELLEDAVANHPDAEYAYVVQPSGAVLVHTFGDSGFPTSLRDLSGGITEDGITHRHFATSRATFHELEAPIIDGEYGAVHVGLSESRLLGVVNGVTAQMLITTVFVAIVGVAAASFLTWFLTRPIVSLVETTRRVGEGDLTARSTYGAQDEIGMLSVAFNQMVDDLESNRTTIAETEAARTRLLKKLITAQEEERKRISRELHDTIGQSLSSIMVGITVLDRMAGEEAASKSRELQLLAGETLTQVRELSRELRPSALDDLGLVPALERYAEDFALRYRRVSTQVHGNLTTRLDQPVETAIYRIVQEAMTNAARHGSAENVSVVLMQRPESVRVVVEDDGSGFEPEAVRRDRTSVGLHAMQERAELLDGEFVIESSGVGSTVYVEIPT